MLGVDGPDTPESSFEDAAVEDAVSLVLVSVLVISSAFTVMQFLFLEDVAIGNTPGHASTHPLKALLSSFF